jgi:hypothetical protein
MTDDRSSLEELGSRIWMCEAQFIREVTLRWVLLGSRSRRLETVHVNESDAR